MPAEIEQSVGELVRSDVCRINIIRDSDNEEIASWKKLPIQEGSNNSQLLDYVSVTLF